MNKVKSIIDLKLKVIDYLIKENCNDNIILYVMDTLETAFDLGFETSEEMERRIEKINNECQEPERKDTIWKRILLPRGNRSSKKV